MNAAGAFIGVAVTVLAVSLAVYSVLLVCSVSRDCL
jgi:hypothetical protein